MNFREKNYSFCRKTQCKIYFPILIILWVFLNDHALAQSSKYISFTQYSQSAEIQQGSTQSLTEYIVTSDNIPVNATLTAADGAKQVPSWLSVNGKLLTGVNYTTGSEISFTFDGTNLSVGKYSATVTATATGYTRATLKIYLTVISGSTGILMNIKVNFQYSATVPPAAG